MVFSEKESLLIKDFWIRWNKSKRASQLAKEKGEWYEGGGQTNKQTPRLCNFLSTLSNRTVSPPSVALDSDILVPIIRTRRRSSVSIVHATKALTMFFSRPWNGSPSPAQSTHLIGICTTVRKITNDEKMDVVG